MLEILFSSSNVDKNCKMFQGLRLPQHRAIEIVIETKLVRHASPCLDSPIGISNLEYTIFPQSLIYAHIFFRNRPWYCQECAWRLDYISDLGSLGFLKYLTETKNKVASLEIYWKCLLLSPSIEEFSLDIQK